MIIEQNHFVCFACKQPFSENRYLKKELYFEHEKKFYPFCGMCSKYIKKIACHSCGLMIPGCVMEICETEMQRGYDGHNWYHEDCLKKIDKVKTGVFAAGVLFGTAGVKILASDDAKKLYTNCTAAVLRAKECILKTAATVQENAEDIYAEAQQINEDRAAKAAEYTDESVEDATEETVAE